MSSKRLILITGTNLYATLSGIDPKSQDVLLMSEDYELCTRYKYHKHKLIFILSAMRSHRDRLSKKHLIHYTELGKNTKNFYMEERLDGLIKRYGLNELAIYEMDNHAFSNRIRNYCEKRKIKLSVYDSPAFLTTHEQFSEYKTQHTRLLMYDFYIWQRKRLNLLLHSNGKPLNGKWSFDYKNRKKLPKKISIPQLPEVSKTSHTVEVSKIVEELFADNPGRSDNFNIPTTREQSILWLDNFLKHRFHNFGTYEDAISESNEFIFHSVLSPLLNVGLLTPDEVVSKTIEYGFENDVPFNSIEGFVRQIIGWREFVRGVYNTVNLKGNFFNHSKKLSSCWYDGTTGLYPLDNVIIKILRNAYCHHIERLMIVSNLMLLCEINPDEVCKWFMELFVDSADWVMVPNVYGMGQYADGGIFATKPYISGSNYILKMSDYKKGDWCEIWDGLYWRFINNNRRLFSVNPRMGLVINMLDKIDNNRKKKIFELAERFIEKVTL